MFETAPPGWLTDFLDGLQYGGYLQAPAAQCERLAHNFVGCNLVANLGDFVTGVGNGWPGSVFGGYGFASYDQLRLWLLTPPASWAELDALIGSPAIAAMQSGSHGFDPWWQINRWLAIEAYLRLLAPRVGTGGPTVRSQSLQMFEAIPTANGLSPQPCSLRGDGARAAFQQWWDAVADAFHHRWQAQAWQGPHPVQLTAVCVHLATHLGQQTGHALRHLTLVKNQRLWNCVQQLNQALSGPVPTPDGWLAGYAGEARAAHQAGDDLEMDATDLGSLVALWQWLPAGSMGALALQLNGCLAGDLTNPPPTLTVSGPSLSCLVRVLNEMLRRIPTRGLPQNWSRIPTGPIPDLFAYPVLDARGVQVNFTQWAYVMNTLYGLPACHC